MSRITNAKSNLPIFVVMNLFPENIMSTSDWSAYLDNFTEWFEQQYESNPGSMIWYVGKYRPINVPENLDVLAVDSLDTAILLKLSMPAIIVDVIINKKNQNS